MNVSLKRIAILLGCAVAAALFASCTKAPEGETGTPASATAEYAVSVNDEMLEALVVTVEYYDSDGSLKTENLTGPWAKRVEPRLPAFIGARIRFAVKDDFDPSESETIRLAYGLSVTGHLFTAEGAKLSNDISYSNASTKTIKTDRLAEWVSRFAGNGVFGVLYYVSPSDDRIGTPDWE